jgi:nitroimidazol reductase NimA-like FMN-containing flavoprotein (pyridoxamine 5'-phosphate oxidase superfamily)
VTDPTEITRILEQCAVVHVSFIDSPAPYVVPLFFGHQPGRLYMHGAKTGTKIDLLRAHAHVGFSAAAEAQIVSGSDACAFTAHGQSVTGKGIARLVEDEEERLHGLDLIMQHYARHGAAAGFTYRESSLSRTAVIAVDIQTMTAKRIGPPQSGRTPL